MKPAFPYQIVTFLGREPQVGEPVYDGANGWLAQLALKRRFKLNGIDENQLVELLTAFFNKTELPNIISSELIKPAQMPVRVIDITNQTELKNFHGRLIAKLGETIVSRYPERDGANYYAHITAEHNSKLVIAANDYANREYITDNIWLIKDAAEDSIAYIKIK